MTMMDQILRVVLALCSTADHQVVEEVVLAAVDGQVEPQAMLALGIIESGLKGRNVLGVRLCYPGKNVEKFDRHACIKIGVNSLKSKLPKNREPTIDDYWVAFAKYNSTQHSGKYAHRAVSFLKILRKRSM